MKSTELVETIPNEAIVIRGGRNRPEDIRRSIGTHPSGVTGISVECRQGRLKAEALGSMESSSLGAVNKVALLKEQKKTGQDVKKSKNTHNSQ